jgi:non-ribosomal peptide synthetase component F
MITVFTIVLAIEIDQWDITLAIPASIRDHPDLKNLIGIFLNVLLIRTIIDPDDTFLNHLDKGRKTVVEALNNQDYPYEMLKEKITAGSPLKKIELFSILFNYLPAGGDKKKIITDFEIEALEMQEISPKYDMTLYVYEGPDRMMLRVVYKGNIYNENSIDRLLSVFSRVLHRLPEDAGLSAARLTIGTGDDLAVMKEDEEDEFEKYFDEGEF